MVRYKKGAESLGGGYLAVIIILAVTVLLIIVGISGGFNYIFSKLNILPGQSLQAVTESCKYSAQAGFSNDYCKTFKKIKLTQGGSEVYVNCQYPDIQDAVIASGISEPPSCEPNEAQEFCDKLTYSEKKDGIDIYAGASAFLCNLKECKDAFGDSFDTTKNCCLKGNYYKQNDCTGEFKDCKSSDPINSDPKIRQKGECYKKA